MDEIQPTLQASPDSARGGCLGQIGWFFSGFVMPLGSFTFYRKAAKGSVGLAILFFFLFTLTATVLSSVGFGYKMLSVGGEIRTSFEDGTIPVIVIRNGVAEVGGNQPMIIVDDYSSTGRLLVAIDTTGRLNQINRNVYSQGFLLTRTELHILNSNGQYQEIALSDLHTIFESDPIIINAESAVRGWNVFSVIVAAVFFILLVIWNSIVRLMFISMIALILWGIVSLFQKSIGFGPVIISGIYALVPALYIHHLLSRANLSMIGLQTLLLISFWLIALFISLSPIDLFTRERPLRLWRALLGLPLLAVIAVDIVFTFAYGGWVILALMGFTVIALAAVGSFLIFRQREESPPPESPMPSM